MTIQLHGNGGYTLTGKHIGIYRQLCQLNVLRLEVKTGLKYSNRFNVFAQIKKEYNLTGNRKTVLTKLEKLFREKGIIKNEI